MLAEVDIMVEDLRAASCLEEEDKQGISNR
jgi:hypothetical protein